MLEKIFDHEKAKELDSLLYLAQGNLAQMIEGNIEFEEYVQNLLKGRCGEAKLVFIKHGVSLLLYLGKKDQKPVLCLKYSYKFVIIHPSIQWLQTFYQEKRDKGLWDVEEALKKLISPIEAIKFFREKFKPKRQ